MPVIKSYCCPSIFHIFITKHPTSITKCCITHNTVFKPLMCIEIFTAEWPKLRTKFCFWICLKLEKRQLILDTYKIIMHNKFTTFSKYQIEKKMCQIKINKYNFLKYGCLNYYAYNIIVINLCLGTLKINHNKHK